VEFESHTVLLLLRPPKAPEVPSDTLDVLQNEHLPRQAELHDQGLLVASGSLAGRSRRVESAKVVYKPEVTNSR